MRIHSSARRFLVVAVTITLFTAWTNSALAQAAPKRATGLRPPTLEERQWMDQNMIPTRGSRLNRLAVDRINTEREAKGLEPVNIGAVPDGEEIPPASSS